MVALIDRDKTERKTEMTERQMFNTFQNVYILSSYGNDSHNQDRKQNQIKLFIYIHYVESLSSYFVDKRKIIIKMH